MKAVVHCSMLYKEVHWLIRNYWQCRVGHNLKLQAFSFVLILFWGRSNARSMYWSFQICCFNLSPIKAEMGVDIAPVFVVFFPIVNDPSVMNSTSISASLSVPCTKSTLKCSSPSCPVVGPPLLTCPPLSLLYCQSMLVQPQHSVLLMMTGPFELLSFPFEIGQDLLSALCQVASDNPD